jgi:hypothetical protein
MPEQIARPGAFRMINGGCYGNPPSHITRLDGYLGRCLTNWTSGPVVGDTAQTVPAMQRWSQVSGRAIDI